MNEYKVYRTEHTIYKVFAESKEHASELVNIGYKRKDISITLEDIEIIDRIELVSSFKKKKYI
jgi:hypothetical protein